MFVAVVAFMFTSCSQDDDFIINNGLDIDSQVPMTRSEPGDGSVNQDRGKLTHIDANSCIIVAIVNSYRQGRSGTWNNQEKTAQEVYNKVMDDAKDLGYKEGNPMSDDMASALYDKYHFDGHIIGNANVVDYFNNHKSGTKIVKYQKKMNGEMKWHQATVESFDTGTGRNAADRVVTVYNEFGSRESINMGQITELRYYNNPKK